MPVSHLFRHTTIVATLLPGLLLTLMACNSGSTVQPQIPLAAVNELLVLTDQQNASLRFDNGAVYHKGGVRGLIVVRQNASTYLAFDRNCPYQPQDTCARVFISQLIQLHDPCCQSRFSFTGQPQGGPATLPLRRYNTALSGNNLTITN
ncbi:Rieske (2Fe-2S) protein [Hymenobacter rubripertinctus]|uniref:Rieske domain-containing protein n=1 Tax=Hymenobacter rubripertinctus TaxID=2029981 RepID=A0A418R4Q1_9BACT|nr:hypothetical protein [Hymenobacter rubripertinctus]RIY12448.1 hypothetical protein D0T11_05425 [Hymenobacter rubripertinctus]